MFRCEFVQGSIPDVITVPKWLRVPGNRHNNISIAKHRRKSGRGIFNPHHVTLS